MARGRENKRPLPDSECAPPQMSHTDPEAHRALSLLTPEEKTRVLHYHFVKDAKMALGSALLKRLAIAGFCGVPWAAAIPTRDARTKPNFRMPSDGAEPLLFNVSHQAGIVVLFAVHDPDANANLADRVFIGIDVVCPTERRKRDHDMITSEGWPRFVDVYDEVFNANELATLKTMRPDAGQDWDGPLRHFYNLWGLHEAYIKMTGEALLASWLKEVDMKNFAPPPRQGEAATLPPLEVWFRGKRVEDVDVQLAVLLDDYIVSTVVKRDKNGSGVPMEEFQSLDIDTILTEAEGYQ